MSHRTSIAIIGVGGEFPQSPTLDRYWGNIVNNVDTASEPPHERWLLPVDDLYNPQVAVADKVYSRKACFLHAEDDPAALSHLDFPAGFVAGLDPLFRLLLRVGDRTLASVSRERIDFSRTGVIIGNLALPSETASTLARDLLGRTFIEQLTEKSLPTGAGETAPLNHYVAGLPAGLLARGLGLQGTCYTVDAACASSLYAIKLAMDELVAGRADTMLAGGLSRPDSLYTQMGFSQLRALSPTGSCAPFDRSGNGLVVGEGCGLVLLKRTEDALRDGDRIHAVIRAVGLSNDLGGNLLAPASEGQLRAMRMAYQQAGWKPSDVDLIECHATGTPVGDAVEFRSLQNLWDDCSWRPGQCVIGSVKANIGHLLTAAGSAALIKTLLAIKHRQLPPMVNFSSPADGIAMEDSPFRILNHATPWSERRAGVPRRAAVSAFGFGGINAHLLLEEWLPKKTARSSVALHPTFQHKSQPVAIVGMGAQFGAWQGLQQLQPRIMTGREQSRPTRPRSWWGAEKNRWFRGTGLSSAAVAGYFVPEVSSVAGQFRIPPKEQEEMLPRQLLMLKVAAEALDDAGLSREDLLFTGVYVGCGLDPHATNFSFRWGLQGLARNWAEELGLQLDETELGEWIAALRDAAGPPLTANRTMGALGSVVASRIAKEFRIGGPSFTLSSEENSGLRALEVAVHQLQAGGINRALVGAVDLAGDLRSVLARQATQSFSLSETARPFDVAADGCQIGEGAAAVILKRLEDARQDGDRIYAVISGLGTASGAPPGLGRMSEDVYERSFQQACDNAHVKPGQLSYLETDGSGNPACDTLEARVLGSALDQQDSRPCYLGSVKADIGHAGSAAGLASLVKVALCLQSRVIPPLRNLERLRPEWRQGRRPIQSPPVAQYWLNNRADGPRRALLAGVGADGSCSHAILEEYQGQADPAAAASMPTGELPEQLFALEGNSVEELLERCAELKRDCRAATEQPLAELAEEWFIRHPLRQDHKLCLSLIAEHRAGLLDQLAHAERRLRETPDTGLGVNGDLQLSPTLRDRVFFSPAPLAAQGKVAFVFPGSGNHYAGMGCELSGFWPQVYAAQELAGHYLADQYLPDRFWVPELDEAVHEDHNALVISHVALCTALHDLLRQFGLQADMVSGYSLGESAGLFSSGAWSDRDGMLQRLGKSALFTEELAGDCRAARRIWELPSDEPVDWTLGMVDASADRVREQLRKSNFKRVYLLIVNTRREAVVGGQRQEVERLVAALGCHFIPLRGVTTVHCEVTRAVADAYRKLHLFEVTPPRGIDFYSCALGRKYPLTSDNAADVILAQALDTIDYPQVVERLYADGARIFLEVGPGSSCSRMIASILDEKPHLVRSLGSPMQSPVSQLLRLLGSCLAERVPVDLAALYPQVVTEKLPATATADGKIFTRIGAATFSPGLPDCKNKNNIKPNGYNSEVKNIEDVSVALSPEPNELPAEQNDPLLDSFMATLQSGSQAHEAYLAFSRDLEQTLARNIALQTDLLQRMAVNGIVPDPLPATTAAPLKSIVRPAPQRRKVAFDREMCLEFAIGSVGRMLGPEFAEVDSYPTRVRLPDEPLMLVDRILSVEGQPKSLSHGRVITEHDVTADRWYLDGDRIPTCVAVEAGQADLFLSGYLGIDFVSKGKAVYRLLDAVVTFHRGLPVPGDTIRYDIRIERFFRQGDTYLFNFNFEGTVNGEPLLSMRRGCAGFFSAEELAAGKGIVHTKLDLLPQPGKRPDDWRDLVPPAREAYSEEQVDALYRGDLAACFGARFAALPIKRPYTMPGGKLKLVDRVTELDPQGGRYGLGRITAEMDIHQDDWFLTCHFVDDRVMPGTLMYECCMHTLRIYLLRMGWVGEEGTTWCEPVPGVASGLKCRGQVVETTRTVTYQVSIKELGYAPEPFAIVDALMFADGHPIVEIPDMSVRLAGLDRAAVEKLWVDSATGTGERQERRPPLYDTERITAFAVGNPSAAFGEPYRIFDNERKIARLPGPPFQFLDRIVAIQGEPWKLVAGATVEAEYDVPADAWYFAANRQPTMPFSVLLETGLQPCGWLAAYLGSALTSEVDLSFRNLDGNAVQHRAVTPDSGTLTTSVKITNISSSGGMIIQSYDFAIRDRSGPVYSGDTVFGFFSQASLARQVGVRGAERYLPSAEESARAEAFAYPQDAPFPETRMRMVETIEHFAVDGGPNGCGFIRGSKQVDPAEWFFKAHFYQDPVWPGSLGLESFLQLLKVVAARRWGVTADSRFETVMLGNEHNWNYRGQIIPGNGKVEVEAVITAADDQALQLTADGYLAVDGKVIYQLKNFSLRLHR